MNLGFDCTVIAVDFSLVELLLTTFSALLMMFTIQRNIFS